MLKKLLFRVLCTLPVCLPANAEIIAQIDALDGAVKLGGSSNKPDFDLTSEKARIVRKYSPEALKLFVKAAEKGPASAQFEIGYIYLHGFGVARNDTEAARWFLKAADQGLASAQSDLGTLYQLGKGVPQSDSDALKW